MPGKRLERSILLLGAFVLAGLARGEPNAEYFYKERVELRSGVTIAYVAMGNPEGEAVLFLHGYTDTSRSFLSTMRHLSALRPDLRLIALDQRGHGDSSMPPPDACRRAPEECFRPADFARDALLFLDALSIEAVSLVGHSMGSLVAQEIALEHPERVRRMVLIAASASVRDNPVVESFLMQGLVEGPWKSAVERLGKRFPDDAYELRPIDIDPGAEKWMAENWVVELAADPELLAAIVPETSRTRIGTWLGVLRALRGLDNSERLKLLRVPTLVIWPRQDVFFPEAPDQELLRASLDAAARELETPYFWKSYGRRPLPESGVQDDLGHNVQWGAPDAVAADLAAFLKTNGEPTPDLYHVDPANPRRVLTARGEAALVRGAARDESSR